jgi:hypothetical protein
LGRREATLERKPARMLVSMRGIALAKPAREALTVERRNQGNEADSRAHRHVARRRRGASDVAFFLARPAARLKTST